MNDGYGKARQRFKLHPLGNSTHEVTRSFVMVDTMHGEAELTPRSPQVISFLTSRSAQYVIDTPTADQSYGSR